jgi:hypothetical protein
MDKNHEMVVQKKALLEKWFRRTREQINLLESRTRNLSVTSPENNDYDYLIDTLDSSFENIKVIRKVLTNDAFIKGFDFKDLKSDK